MTEDFNELLNLYEDKEESEEIESIQVRNVSMEVPEIGDLLDFCKRYQDEDPKLKQFYYHTAPKHNKKRGGGGWSGVVMNTLMVLRKMKRKGEL